MDRYDSFKSHIPVDGIRWPRVGYYVEDPNCAPLEKLREVFGLRQMKAVYLRALQLGALQILKEVGVSVESEISPEPLPDMPIARRRALARQAREERMRFRQREALAGSASESRPQRAARSPTPAAKQPELPKIPSPVIPPGMELRSGQASESTPSDFERIARMQLGGGRDPGFIETRQEPVRQAPSVAGSARPYRASTAADAQFDQFGD